MTIIAVCGTLLSMVLGYYAWRKRRETRALHAKFLLYERVIHYSFRRHLPYNVRVQVNRAMLLGSKEFVVNKINLDAETPFNLEHLLRGGTPAAAVSEFLDAIQGDGHGVIRLHQR